LTCSIYKQLARWQSASIPGPVQWPDPPCSTAAIPRLRARSERRSARCCPRLYSRNGTRFTTPSLVSRTYSTTATDPRASGEPAPAWKCPPSARVSAGS